MPPPMFLAAGGMNVLVDMLKATGNDKAHSQAAGALFEACANNTQANLFKAGGIRHMVELLLRTDQPDLQAKLAQAIAAACAEKSR